MVSWPVALTLWQHIIVGMHDEARPLNLWQPQIGVGRKPKSYYCLQGITSDPTCFFLLFFLTCMMCGLPAGTSVYLMLCGMSVEA